MTVLYTQLHNMFNTFDQSEHSQSKRGIIHSLFNLFVPSSSTEEINVIKNNMEIFLANQDCLSTRMKETFNIVNLTYAEANTNILPLCSLQQDIVQINSTVHHLSKELKAVILDRNFFIILFQIRNHLATLHNGLNSLRKNVLSIINQVSVICSQKLIPALLSPHDLTSLLTKLESKLISHP